MKRTLILLLLMFVLVGCETVVVDRNTKHAEVHDNQESSFEEIDSRQECEDRGGKWVKQESLIPMFTGKTFIPIPVVEYNCEKYTD